MRDFTDSMLDAAKGGDRQAVSELIRTWHRPLRAYIASLLLRSPDVDDVAQEAFLRALERLDRVPDALAIGAFLRGIARNVVRERQRKFVREGNAYQRLLEDRGEEQHHIERSSWLSDPKLLEALKSCLQGLSEPARKMLTLRYTDELTSDQIGEQVGSNGPAVRAAMRRARNALLSCLRGSYAPAKEMG